MNVFNLDRCFSSKVRRGWTRIYICIDLHDTIVEGKYNTFNEGAQYMPNSIRVLQQLSKREDICLILWTSSYWGSIKELWDDMKNKGVLFKYLNENPECNDTDLCDFSIKPYFNILIDDKAGFVGNYGNGDGDWFLIEKELRRIGEW